MVGRFLDYTMKDERIVTEQVQELQMLINENKAKGMVLPEPFLVAAIIHKLPGTWKEFKSYLMFKNKEMTLETLFYKLNVTEGNRARERAAKEAKMAKANMVEHGRPSSSGVRKNQHDKRSDKQKGKSVHLGPKGGVTKKQKEKF